MNSYTPITNEDQNQIAAIADLADLAKGTSALKVSLEMLYHFQCGHCQKWWSVGDFEWQAGKLVYCPHCAKPGQTGENPLLAEDFNAG